jgi:hypothetical protein
MVAKEKEIGRKVKWRRGGEVIKLMMACSYLFERDVKC